MQEELNAGLPPPLPPPPSQGTAGEKRSADEATMMHGAARVEEEAPAQQQQQQQPEQSQPQPVPEPERERLRRLARRDSGEQDPKIKKGTADGPGPEMDMTSAMRDMMSRQGAKTDETMDKFGRIIDNNTPMVHNVKQEVLMTIAMERMERQNQFIDMAKDYDRRFQ